MFRCPFSLRSIDPNGHKTSLWAGCLERSERNRRYAELVLALAAAGEHDGERRQEEHEETSVHVSATRRRGRRIRAYPVGIRRADRRSASEGTFEHWRSRAYLARSIGRNPPTEGGLSQSLSFAASVFT